MTQLRWRDMLSEGLATKHGKEQSWAQMIMAANTPMLLRAGLVDGDTRAGVLASGQVVGMLSDLPSCAELISGIVAEAEAIIGKLPSVLE
jgi:NAD(P)H-dependent flavin oxidoreductase YrpB (nitropropane dioxygenase family)